MVKDANTCPSDTTVFPSRRTVENIESVLESVSASPPPSSPRNTPRTCHNPTRSREESQQRPLFSAESFAISVPVPLLNLEL